ncbi:MAG: hypothetical protein L6R40_003352 [Gallowayella cf. fulva]|nr:MAG: hypothetical protein L6R40_003352 [Xanthomendoza cf. fulva]
MVRKGYIIEELITGGDLMSYIERHEWRVNSNESCLIVFQVLKAISYLHRNGITHRDLKPENILMSSTVPGARVVLTDFGGATKAATGRSGVSNRMLTMTGTAHYAAPEVGRQNGQVNLPGYTNAVDMWSIGCVAVAMLVGRSPFAKPPVSGSQQGCAATVIIEAARCDLGGLNVGEVWGDVDPKARDFVRRLLVLDENARLTADQGLKHEWFGQESEGQLMDSRYERATADWRPSSVGWDFKEGLDRYIEVRIPEEDVRRPTPFPKVIIDVCAATKKM